MLYWWTNQSLPRQFGQVKSLAVLWLMMLWAAGAVLAGDTIRVGGLDGPDFADEHTTYPVLLALSGGGARGFASIGVLKAFEEKGIRVAAVAGTSMGGIVGGLYACGYSPNDLERVIRQTDFNSLFTNEPARSTMFLTQRQERDRHLLSIRFRNFRPHIPQGLTAGQKLTSLFADLTLPASYRANGDFSRFRIPFKAVTTDVANGRMVVLSEGSMAEAMRATMAFPLAFTGLERDSMLLMDGGMVMPVPVEIVRQMCDTARFVVAINTTSPLLPKDDLRTPVDIANQVTTIMVADQLESQLQHADYVIHPLPDRFASADFDSRDSIIAAGYNAGLTAADSIIDLLKARPDTVRYRIALVRSANPQGSLDETIARQLIGKTLTRTELIAELKGIARRHQLFEIKGTLDAPESEPRPDGQADACTLALDYEPALPVSRVKFCFEGATLYHDSTLQTLMNLTDSLLLPSVLRVGLDRIVAQYRRDGHDLAEVAGVVIDAASRQVTIRINEAIIRRIDVFQNARTRDWLVRSYLPLKVGQSYSTGAAAKGVANIYGTDLFDRVSYDLRPVDSGAAMSITVEEKNYSQLRLGWHWDDEYKSEEFAELLNDNWLGMGMEYQVHGRYSERRRLIFGELKANRIFATYLTGQIRLYTGRLERSLFDTDGSGAGRRIETKWGGLARFGQQIYRLGTVTGRYRREHVAYETTEPRTKSSFELSSLSLESLVETYDRYPFPASGKRHFFELEMASKYLGGEVDYTRLHWSVEAFFPLSEVVNYHPRLVLGWSREGLPASEKFYLGGQESFAGYRTDRLSGDKLFSLTQELRFRLPFRFYTTFRYDLGEVYADTDEIKLRNLRHGFGAALSYDSPFGPIVIGYGRASSDDDRLYFSAGLAF